MKAFLAFSEDTAALSVVALLWPRGDHVYSSKRSLVVVWARLEAISDGALTVYYHC